MKNSCFLLINIFLLCSILNSCINTYNYDIDDYKLTMELNKNNNDVKTTIEIIYNVKNGSKSDGFKFVGNNTVDSLMCSDESGPIAGEVNYLKETKISWKFNTVSSGTKSIKAVFILRNSLRNDGEKMSLDVPWAGVFRVPVNHSKFVVLSHAIYKLDAPSSDWQINTSDDKILCTLEQNPLHNKAFSLEFKNTSK